MKTTKKVIAAIAFAAVQWRVTAATVEVTTVAELTNAVARVNAGEQIGGEAIDTIVLKRGTYTFPDDVFMADNTVSKDNNAYCKFRLSLEKGNVTIRGEDDSSRNGWTHESEPVVIEGNGGKALQIQIPNNQSAHIENIAFANCFGGHYAGDSVYGNRCNGGAIGIGRIKDGVYTGSPNVVISNCVFRGNTSALGGAVGSSNTAYTMRDCFFTNNVAENKGGCMISGKAYNCDFVGNGSVGASVNEVAGCRFIANLSTTGHDVLSADSVSDCQFVTNVISDASAWGDIVNAPFISNCHFTNNVSARYGIAYSNGGTVTNCTFYGNKAGAQNRGAITDPGLVVRCAVTKNTGASAGGLIVQAKGIVCRVKDTWFAENSNSTGGGAAKLSVNLSGMSAEELASPRMVFDNCTFETNTCSGGKHGGAIYNAASNIPEGVPLESLIVCSNNCLFAGNTATHACAVEGVTAIGCEFSGNVVSGGGFNLLGSDAALSRLIDCDLTGGNLYKCSVDRCRVHEVTSCGAFNIGCNVTNTLVYGCVIANANHGLIGRQSTVAAVPSEFVNCTFAANRGNFFAATNIVRLVNCAFFDNTNCLGKASSVSFSAAGDNNGAITFGHCAFGPLSSVDLSGVADNYCLFDVNPKFAEAPPWSPSLRSPLCGNGDPSMWTAESVDLAGNLRLRDGKVDIGCYQCWLRAPGFILVVR